jgi:hypothetical protein
MDEENLVCIHNGVLLSHKEELNPVICSKMDGTGENRLSEISQTQERSTRHSLIMWKLKHTQNTT